MAKKNRNDYFELMAKQVEISAEAATLLEKVLKDFDYSAISRIREEMHEIEHRGDMLHHDILSRLSAEFITPIDQEDILRLVQLMDDITDALDEVILEFYMFDCRQVPAAACELSGLIKRCVAALLDAMKELKNFKKPEKLRKLLVEVNDIEEQADAVYIEALHALFAGNADAKMLIGHKAIYESLENCCDMCEHVSDIVEQIIIKNT